MVWVVGRISLANINRLPSDETFIWGRGNKPPEKNIKIKKGKQPMVIRSKMVLKKAATSKLMAMRERQERREMMRKGIMEKELWYPSQTAVK